MLRDEQKNAIIESAGQLASGSAKFILINVEHLSFLFQHLAEHGVKKVIIETMIPDSLFIVKVEKAK